MSRILKTIRLIEKQIKGWVEPSVTRVSRSRSPYRVLISCILSLRTKDKATTEASGRLFKVADNPEKMLKLSRQRLQKLIYPVCFYRNKAGAILSLSRKLVEKYGGRVPRSEDELLKLSGVGRKTANLVLGLGFGIPAMCVDTHVHRISNRLGWVKTETPEETEYALREIVPKREWVNLNTTLVTFGQNLCLPVSPFCSRCAVNRLCRKRGVRRWR